MIQAALALAMVVDLSPRMPPIASQGGWRACAAFAVANAKSVARGVRLSPWYIYSLKSPYQHDCWENYSMTVEEAVSIVRDGCVTWDEHPNYGPCIGPEQATDYRTKEAIQLCDCQGDCEPDELRSWLDRGYPVIVSVPVYHEMAAYQCGQIVDMPQDDELYTAHTVLIVGYGDVFKFANSCGERWGCGGYGYVSAEFLQQFAYEAWVLMEDYPHEQYIPLVMD